MTFAHSSMSLHLSSSTWRPYIMYRSYGIQKRASIHDGEGVCKQCGMCLLQKSSAEPVLSFSLRDAVTFASTLSVVAQTYYILNQFPARTPHYLRYLMNLKEKITFHLNKMFVALDIMDRAPLNRNEKEIRVALAGTIRSFINRLSITRKGIGLLIEMKGGELFPKIVFEQFMMGLMIATTRRNSI